MYVRPLGCLPRFEYSTEVRILWLAERFEGVAKSTEAALKYVALNSHDKCARAYARTHARKHVRTHVRTHVRILPFWNLSAGGLAD
jgi:hypothetical protein